MKTEQIVEVLKNRLQMAKEENNPTESAFLEEVIKAVDGRDCNQCQYVSKHATEYPCSHCRNCYVDQFKPKMDGKDGAGE
jgi:hypothetical protein